MMWGTKADTRSAESEIQVQVHPIDALDLQHHVLVEHFGHRAGYGHRGLRSTQARIRPTNRFGRFKAAPSGTASRLGRSLRSPDVTAPRTPPRRAGAKPR